MRCPISRTEPRPRPLLLSYALRGGADSSQPVRLSEHIRDRILMGLRHSRQLKRTRCGRLVRSDPPGQCEILIPPDVLSFIRKPRLVHDMSQTARA